MMTIYSALARWLGHANLQISRVKQARKNESDCSNLFQSDQEMIWLVERRHFAVIIRTNSVKHNTPQDAVGCGNFAPDAAIWRSIRSNIVWRPTGAVIWRTGRSIRIVSWPIRCNTQNMTSSTKPEVHNVSALSSKQDRVTATGT